LRPVNRHARVGEHIEVTWKFEYRIVRLGRAFPAGIANARARSVAAPIANREPQKSTGGGRKCSQLFPVEHKGGGGKIALPVDVNGDFGISRLKAGLG